MSRRAARGHIESRLLVACLCLAVIGSMIGYYAVSAHGQEPTIMNTQTSTPAGAPCGGGTGPRPAAPCIVTHCDEGLSCTKVWDGELLATGISPSATTIALGTESVSVALVDGDDPASIRDAMVAVNFTCEYEYYEGNELVAEWEEVTSDSQFIVPAVATYTWTFSGGNERIVGSGAAINVNTASLAPGVYSVACTVDLNLAAATFAGRDITCAEPQQTVTYTFPPATLTVEGIDVTFKSEDGSTVLSAITLAKGRTEKVLAVIAPASAAELVVFSSTSTGNVTVATIGRNGGTWTLALTGVADGPASITAKHNGTTPLVNVLSVTVKTVLWELSYWIAGGTTPAAPQGQSNAPATTLSRHAMTVVPMADPPPPSEVVLTEDEVSVPANVDVHFRHKAVGNWFQNTLSSCEITWTGGMETVETSADGTNSVVRKSFTPGDHTVTATARWRFLWFIPAGEQVRSVTVKATQVTLPAVTAIAKGGQHAIYVTVTPSPPAATVVLELVTTTGTGAATFDNGASQRTLNQSETVTIHGDTESSEVDNVKLVAKVNGTEVASETFSVVAVQLPSITAVGKGSTQDATITFAPTGVALTVDLELSAASGTGSATFAANATTKQITQGETVTISGVTESSAVDNIKLAAKVNGTEVASEDFSVVAVQLPSITAVSRGHTLDVAITYFPPVTGLTVDLEIARTSGNSGDATFAGGIGFIPITHGGTVTIHGVTESSEVDNIEISANIDGTEVANEAFSVFTVRIMQGTSDITDSIGLPTLAGTGIRLEARVNPPNLTPDSILWSIPGIIVGGWDVPSDKLSAAVIPIPQDDLKRSEVHFYWVNGSRSQQDPNGTWDVKVTATFGSDTVTCQSNFSVLRPFRHLSSPHLDQISVEAYPGSGEPALMFGSHSRSQPGIVTSVLVDSVPGFSDGTLQWVQVCYYTFRTYLTNDEFCQMSGSSLLDKTYPYQNSSYIEGRFVAQDLPSLVVHRADTKEVSVNDTFRLYLMYKPSGNDSIWIPLERFEWGWYARASKAINGDWVPDPSNVPWVSYSPEPTFEFPTWSGNILDLQWVLIP